jgi:hypothetical protein
MHQHSSACLSVVLPKSVQVPTSMEIEACKARLPVLVRVYHLGTYVLHFARLLRRRACSQIVRINQCRWHV